MIGSNGCLVRARLNGVVLMTGRLECFSCESGIAQRGLNRVDWLRRNVEGEIRLFD